MPIPLLIIILIILVAVVVVFCIFYRQLLLINNKVNRILSDIEDGLNSIIELAPNIIDIVKKNDSENNTFETSFLEVQKTFSNAYSVADLVTADKKIINLFSDFLTSIKPKSELNADPDFQRQIMEFLSIENKLLVLRESYNSGAKAVNKKLKTFPINIVNLIIGHFNPRKLYEIGNSEKVKMANLLKLNHE